MPVTSSARGAFSSGSSKRPNRNLLESRTLLLLGEACFSLGSLDDSLRYLRDAIDAAEGDLAAVATAEAEIAWVPSRLRQLRGSRGRHRPSARRRRGTRGDSTAQFQPRQVGHSADFFVLGRPLDEEKLARALALEDLDWPSPIERRPSFILGLHAPVRGAVRPGAANCSKLSASALVERGEEG